jgi:hypothetical protein
MKISHNTVESVVSGDKGVKQGRGVRVKKRNLCTRNGSDPLFFDSEGTAYIFEKNKAFFLRTVFYKICSEESEIRVWTFIQTKNYARELPQNIIKISNYSA